MSKCSTHNRTNCTDSSCKRHDNAGQIGFAVNDSFSPTIGIGSGMTIDPKNGHLGLNLGGGMSFDF